MPGAARRATCRAIGRGSASSDPTGAAPHLGVVEQGAPNAVLKTLTMTGFQVVQASHLPRPRPASPQSTTARTEAGSARPAGLSDASSDGREGGRSAISSSPRSRSMPRRSTTVSRPRRILTRSGSCRSIRSPCVSASRPVLVVKRTSPERLVAHALGSGSKPRPITCSLPLRDGQLDARARMSFADRDAGGRAAVAAHPPS